MMDLQIFTTVLLLAIVQGEFIVPSAVEGGLDETVILECKLQGSYRWYAISWKKVAEDGTENIIVSLPSDTKTPEWDKTTEAYYKRRYEPIIITDAELTQFSLKINGLTCSDRGSFQCSVAGNFPEKMKMTEVTVGSEAEKPEINSDVVVLERNTTYDLECQAEVGMPPAELVWYHQSADAQTFQIVPDQIEQVETNINACEKSAVKTHTLQVRDDLEGSIYRCAVRGRHNHGDFFDDIKIELVGLPTTPNPEPECDGVVCISEDDNGSSISSYACILIISSILLHFL